MAEVAHRLVPKPSGCATVNPAVARVTRPAALRRQACHAHRGYVQRARRLGSGLLRPSVVGIGVLCACLLAACSKSEGPPHPRSAVDAYTAALREGRTRDAYELLSAEAQKTLSFEAFDRMVRENPSELEAMLDALQRPSADPYVTARITAPDGETLLLVYEDGAWRVDASAVDLFGQRTPEQAVRSFLRAFEGRRYDILLRFVPDAHREGLDAETLKKAWEGEQKEEMAQLVSSLAAGLAEARVEVVGDRATLVYGSGSTVELLREHGLWKIEDFR